MAEAGESFKSIVNIMGAIPKSLTITPTLAPPINTDCCFERLVFGALTGSDPFENDHTRFINRYPNGVTAVSYVLQKCNNGEMEDVVTITDNTLGEFFAFDFFQSDSYSYIEFYLSWQAVLLAHGAGVYRIKTIEANILASLPDQNQFSDQYVLKVFSAEAADGTVRLDTVTSGILGNKGNRAERFAFPPNSQDSCRVPGWFGSNEGEYESSYTRYNDGLEVPLELNFREGFTLDIDRMPECIHNYLAKWVFMASDVFITDYNSDNANEHVLTRVTEPSDYEPGQIKRSKLYKVSTKFKSAFDNNRKLNC